MEQLVWIGTSITVLGLGGLIWCILAVRQARRDATDEGDLTARLQRLVAVNLGALGVSALGLMLVIVALFLS